MKDYQYKKQNIGVWYANVILSTIFTYFCMHLIATNKIAPILVTSNYHFLALISLFLMIHDLLRYLFKSQKCEEVTDQPLNKCLQNIISNTILYTIILISLLFQDTSSIISPSQHALLLQLFLWGRILFSLGYLFGTIFNVQSLRSYGFGLCIASLATFFSAHFNANFIRKFV